MIDRTLCSPSCGLHLLRVPFADKSSSPREICSSFSCTSIESCTSSSEKTHLHSERSSKSRKGWDEPPVILPENLRPVPTASLTEAKTNHVYPLPRKTRRLFIALHYLLTAITPVVGNALPGAHSNLFLLCARI
ncbi:hypothetical protein CDAR_75191 [Caerostris darwini]|uniref:Uncharacterized protein n=1 Tax=Caerostris darwini TaxID=1538125 RepID=A0AAV4QX83_9ARAC|nr:hypothetical protein CDAR_75191 [Caerostris darwini]